MQLGSSDESRISQTGGGGKTLLFGETFAENCMKIKELDPGGEREASLASPP